MGESASQLETAYASYVRRHYLAAPEEAVWDGWRRQRPEGENLDQMIRRVQDYLAQQAAYTLTPGTLPEGEDFVQYFLFENRQGYCTHFASAATLLLRFWSIPARYVEGYVVFPENFQDNGDGTWTAWVTDQSAHAWAEVYRDGVSWQPVEATPPYLTGTVPPASETPREEETEEAAPLEETEPPASSEPETEASSGMLEAPAETESSASRLPAGGEAEAPRGARGPLALVIFLTAVVLGIGAAVKCWRREERRRRIKSRNRRAALLALGEEAERLLAKKPGDLSLLEKSFGEKAMERVQGMSRQELEELADLVKRAWFSGQPVTEEAYQRGWELYEKIRDHLYPALTPWQRFWREIP